MSAVMSSREKMDSMSSLVAFLSQLLIISSASLGLLVKLTVRASDL